MKIPPPPPPSLSSMKILLPSTIDRICICIMYTTPSRITAGLTIHKRHLSMVSSESAQEQKAVLPGEGNWGVGGLYTLYNEKHASLLFSIPPIPICVCVCLCVCVCVCFPDKRQASPKRVTLPILLTNV